MRNKNNYQTNYISQQLETININAIKQKSKSIIVIIEPSRIKLGGHYYSLYLVFCLIRYFSFPSIPYPPPKVLHLPPTKVNFRIHSTLLTFFNLLFKIQSLYFLQNNNNSRHREKKKKKLKMKYLNLNILQVSPQLLPNFLGSSTFRTINFYF